jgi:cyanophycinase
MSPIPGTLYLCGGSKVLDLAAAPFAAAAGAHQARIALLLQGGSNWQKYVPGYSSPLALHGVTQVEVIVPAESGELDLDSAAAVLQSASGILIGGGHTPTYQQLYACGPIADLLRERWQQGIPLCGISAGALILARHTLVAPDELGEKQISLLPGLGLLPDHIIGVHFSEQNYLPHMLAAMNQTQIPEGLGMDEGACAVWENGQLKMVIGRTVYEVSMTDFARQKFTLRPRP